MAESAMHPEQALQTIAQVRHRRQRMTGQAAGQVWMVWGLVLGLIGFASQSAFHAAYHVGWVDPTFIVVGGAVGAMLTNAIWRAHALETDPQHKPWVPWALGIGGLMLLGGFIVLSNVVPVDAPAPTLSMAPLALMGAYGATAITLATRKRVPQLPGWVAVAVLLAVFAVARLVTFGQRTSTVDFLGSSSLNAINILTFTIVGWVHFRRG